MLKNQSMCKKFTDIYADSDQNIIDKLHSYPECWLSISSVDIKKPYRLASIGLFRLSAKDKPPDYFAHFILWDWLRFFSRYGGLYLINGSAA